MNVKLHTTVTGLRSQTAMIKLIMRNRGLLADVQ